MLARCTATVLTLSSSLAAISRFDLPVADQLQHLELARGQRAVRSPVERRRRSTRRIEHRLAGGDALDRGREVQVERVLQDVAARAGLHRLPHQRLLGVHAEHQDRRRPAARRESGASPRARSCPASRSPSRRPAAAARRASRTASSPSLASPTTVDRRIVLEHAAKAAPHEAWSSTSRTVILIRHAHVTCRPPIGRAAPSVEPACRRPRGRQELERAAHQRRALAHRHQAEARAARCPRVEARLPWSSTSSSSAIRREAQAHPRARRRPSAAPRCSAPPAARDTRGWPIGRDRPAAAIPLRSYDHARCRVCVSTRREIPVDRAFEARASSRIDGCSVCDRPRTLSSAVCAISPTSRRSAAQRRSFGRVPCRPAPSIEPIAVRIWPNSSCSSREISRSVDSRVAISCCASSRRSSDSAASSREQPAVGANQIQARGDDRRQRRGEEPVDLALHPA